MTHNNQRSRNDVGRPTSLPPWSTSEGSHRCWHRSSQLRVVGSHGFSTIPFVAEDLSGSFTTHARYLRAFAQMMGFPAGASAEQARRVIAELARMVTTAYPSPGKPRGAVNEDVVVQCLGRAWGTERLLGVSRALSDGDDAMTRLANTWCTVQAYYICHSATQALCVAEGASRPSQHTVAKKEFVNLWVSRGNPVAPLSFAAISPKSKRKNQTAGFLNGPNRPLDPNVHAWSACTDETCWDIAGKALRTTRDDAVKQKQQAAKEDLRKAKRREWQQDNEQRVAAGRRPKKEPQWPANPRLSAAAKSRCEEAVREYTMVDYLYRLRVKANYEDAHMFTEGPDDDYVSTQVVKDLIGLSAGTLVAHEIRIARQMSTDWLVDTATRWITNHKTQSGALDISHRIDLIRDVLA